ncbi:uncharacterized protein [Cherax quadricarinatus]|uniref:uncharacterized protein n=1 Tax=Cherax quadricarinatus TaxID=27406 RepID=UPI00387ECE34
MKCQPEGERLRHPTKSPGEPRFSTYGPPAERQTTYGASRQQYPERHQPERHHLQRHQGVKGKPVVCFRCNKVGHISSNCPQKPQPIGKISNIPSNMSPREVEKGMAPYYCESLISLQENSEPTKVNTFRDTGAYCSLVREGILPLSENTSLNSSVLLEAYGGAIYSVPLHKIYVQCKYYTGYLTVGISKGFPMKNAMLLLGNNITTVTSCPEPIMINASPVLAITRATSQGLSGENVDLSLDDSDLGIATLFYETHRPESRKSSEQTPIKPSYSQVAGLPDVSVSMPEGLSFREEQRKDPSLKFAFEAAMGKSSLGHPVKYEVKNDYLVCTETGKEIEGRQLYDRLVVPTKYRPQILNIAHNTSLGGHLGITKTLYRITKEFYWPKLKKDVKNHIRCCRECQQVGKPGHSIKPAPLQPIPADGEPFADLIIDCVGPLPKSKSGNQYLFTIMDKVTRYPEAIPMRSINTKAILKALTKFISCFGIPKTIQSDQGTNFTAKAFREVLTRLGIIHNLSTAYHPQSQGALERFHQTLKTMMRSFCMHFPTDWDESLPLLLFSVRETVQESTGYSPFELIFGHNVRGPLRVLKEGWMGEDVSSALYNPSSRLQVAQLILKSKGYFSRK